MFSVGDPAQREVQDVEDDEGQQDQPRVEHCPRGDRGLHGSRLHVRLTPGDTIHPRQLDRVDHMEDERGEQRDPEQPQQRPKVLELGGVGVDVFRRQEDLQVANQVDDDKADHHQASKCHDPFLADGRPVKGDEAVRRDGPHRGGVGSGGSAHSKRGNRAECPARRPDRYEEVLDFLIVVNHRDEGNCGKRHENTEFLPQSVFRSASAELSRASRSRRSASHCFTMLW